MSTRTAKTRRSLPSRHSSLRSVVCKSASNASKLIPLTMALGGMGGSEAFAPPPPALSRASSGASIGSIGSMGPPSLNRARSCPGLGRDGDLMEDESVSSFGTATHGMPSFDLADATRPLMEAASNGADMMKNWGENLMSAGAGMMDKAPEVDVGGMNLLSQMSHGLSDVSATFTKAIFAAKAAEVASRLFLVGQVMPDHQLTPTEAGFQVAFLAVACNTIYQNVVPKIKTAEATKFLTPGDRKAFQSVFKPAGMDWQQYQKLNAGSMEWVNLEAGQSMEMDGAYWLWKGDMEYQGEGPVPPCLIGEDHIAKTLGLADEEDVSSKVVVAGTEGAQVLKINTGKLGEMIQKDNSLQATVGALLFNTLQEKLEWAKSNFAEENTLAPELVC